MADSTESYVDILYREDKDGKGAIFDHHRLREVTGLPTRAVFYYDDEEKSLNAERVFLGAHQAWGYTFQFDPPPCIHFFRYRANGGARDRDAPPNELVKHERKMLMEPGGGLFVFPGKHGWTKMGVNEGFDRQVTELFKVLKGIGRPVLAICASTLVLGRTDHWEIENLTGHSSGRSPQLNNEGGIVYNSLLHGLDLVDGSLLDGLAKKKGFVREKLLVNSVHSYQLADRFPSNTAFFEVSARSTDGNEESHRHPMVKKGRFRAFASGGVIEAIEARKGAPILGAQFHPEAFDSRSTPSNFGYFVIRAMAEAGCAYWAKRTLVGSFPTGADDEAIATPPPEANVQEATPPPSPEPDGDEPRGRVAAMPRTRLPRTDE
ncbi:hypothetical protein HDU67_008060 [Dinochytrium kinnereticum]|nr:hypothetical protein HDU67_008060 [Dinochytrium kinnereticum]